MASPSSFKDRPGFRRSSSVVVAPPRSLSYHERAGLDKSDASEDVLYSTPSARIVKFIPSTAGISLTSAPIPHDTDYPVDTIETLPWRSTTETTLATGRLIIEKVRGSTNFLKCQTVMQAIMRNSQCWLVDGVSKFVLRVGKLQYYRIELPTTTEEERKKVEEFQVALRPILRFEITPCPFKRGFHVELPEDAITPRRKGQWKRRESSLPSSQTGDTPPSRGKTGRVWKPRTASAQSGTEASPSRTDSGYGDGSENEVGNLKVGKTRSAISAKPESEESEEEEDLEEESEEVEDTSSDESVPSELPEPVLEALNIENAPLAQDHAFLQPEASVKTSIPLKADEERHAIEESKAFEVEDAEDAEDAEHQHPDSSLPKEDEIVPSGEKKSLIHSAKASEHSELTADDEDDGEAPQSAARSMKKEVPLMAQVEQHKLTDSNPEPLTEEPAPVIEHDQDSEDSTEEAATVPDESTDRKEITPITTVETNHTTELRLAAVEVLPAATPELLQESEVQSFVNEVLLASTVDAHHEPELQPADKDSTDEEEASPEKRSEDALSVISSADSFHTSASMDDFRPSHQAAYHDDLTPLAESQDPWRTPVRSHKRDLSEITVTASSPEAIDNSPESPELANLSSPIQDRLRHRLKSQRSLSPLPPSTISLPSQRQQQGNHMTAALLQKACSLALVKPIEVMILIAHILARIASGATVNDLMSGDLFKKPQTEHRRRSSNLPDQMDVGRDDADEDDFGIPIRGRQRSNEPERDADEDADSLLDLD